ncbi:hypothetical protein V6N13_017920 [Hibiscus sabdariffa]|uniref:Uncharacterized protein n=1 Tax=Hibiscus sabdariffa TaxID=183260 RepID=A0ABR2CH26_9ROSI
MVESHITRTRTRTDMQILDKFERSAPLDALYALDFTQCIRNPIPQEVCKLHALKETCASAHDFGVHTIGVLLPRIKVPHP